MTHSSPSQGKAHNGNDMRYYRARHAGMCSAHGADHPLTVAALNELYAAQIRWYANQSMLRAPLTAIQVRDLTRLVKRAAARRVVPDESVSQ